MLETSRAGFESVDIRLEKVARTLGRTDFYIFWRVTLPLAWRSVLAGVALTFARGIGGFRRYADGGGQHPQTHADHVHLHLRPGAGQPAG